MSDESLERTQAHAASNRGSSSKGKLMNVGFIGLGHMGAGMTENLLKAGHRVTVFNRTPAKAEPLIALGATLANSIAEASRGDAVVTMLANDEAVEDIVLGDDGVIANLPSGGLHVSSSTISVTLSQRLTEAHSRKSQKFVAAPVFGRPDVAAAGRLFVVAGGDAAAIEAALPCSRRLDRKRSSFPICRRPPIW
jgi:3-hydroxyisobutyrate dehydrogenase-like beta-hydroxyacid dehydrogenase